MTAALKVDVWSDVACPWCYIGRRRFAAGAAASGVPVELEYHAFELAPDTPADFEGGEIDFLASYKGIPPEQAAAVLDQTAAIAADAGLDLRFDRVRHTRTLLAHELLHHAKAHGRQSETAEALFRAYFTEGRHIGRPDELVEIAASAGLDPDPARAALADHRYAADVRADLARAVASGIRAVPFFVIDGRYGVAGAQDPTVFAGALQQVAAERAASR